MINLTAKPIISDDLTIHALKKHIQSALVELEQQAGDDPSRSLRQKLICMSNAANGLKSFSNVDKLVGSLCEIATNEARADDPIALSTSYFATESKDTRSNIRSFCRRVLYSAWCVRHVVLPAYFKMEKSVPPHMRRDSPSSVLRELANCEPSGEETKKFGKHIRQALNLYSLTWIYCTDWISFSDIKLEEEAQLHVFMSEKNRGSKSNPSTVEKAIMFFAGRGYLKCDVREFKIDKSEAQYEVSRSNVIINEIDAFKAPKKRTNRSHFYIYPDLEMRGVAPPKSTIQVWDKFFSDYMVYREDTERTAIERQKKSLHVLADYIAIVLPMFQEEDSGNILIPASPLKFTRYPFVDQSYNHKSFPTYLEYLKRRGLTSSSRQANLYTIIDFFHWVELNLIGGEIADITGPKFTSPFSHKDIPFVPRPTGTNKVPFTKDVYPMLFMYIHEVERIGMYLDAHPEAAEKVCKFTGQAGNHIIDLRQLDVEFNFSYQDELFNISQIPQRLIVGCKMASNGVNLSALRLLMFIIETGQRGQNAQWLDKDQWSRNLVNFDDEGPTRIIHINTDKVGNTLDIWVLSRVVELLKRQQDHRIAKRIPNVVRSYEGRAKSKFEPIVPLFSNEDGSVIHDSRYPEVWADLMLGLQGFLYENGMSVKPLIVVKPASKLDPGKRRPDGSKVCELNWSPIHTPHAARTSFVTRRAGSSSYVILAELLGHADPMVTAYYDVPDFEEVMDALKPNDRPAVDASSPISELRSQLTSPDYQRDDVIRRFGINSLSDVYGSKCGDRGGQGVELLKNTQAAELVFRDTHICVVGEICPDDVILAAGAAMQCGTCKLACKSVDHLPAIEAKCRALFARVQATSAELKVAKNAGNDRALLRRISDRLTSDTYQLVGWQDASVTLRRLFEEKKRDGVVAGSPEIIKLHLERVVRQTKPAQFLIDRIVDAKMYPSLCDDVLRLQASRIARQISISETSFYADKNEEVMALYSYIKTRLTALGKTWDDAGRVIEEQVGGLIFDENSLIRDV